MNLEMTGRQVEITPALREFAEEKLRKLEKLLGGPLEVHVVLEIAKHRHVADIQVKARTASFSGMEETSDLYASISEVAEKIERQALRHKEKVTGRRRREGARAPKVGAALEAEANRAKPPAQGEEQTTRIIRSERYRLKPLSPEDAVMELEASEEKVLVFRDSASDRVNVLYRRSDGHFGLVEPEY
jgi:putative sigma-54 modulation protein